MHYFHKRKSLKKQLAETILCSEKDGRPFINLDIGGIICHGLLDSGANVSVLCHNSCRFIDNPNVNFHPFPSTLNTAGGEQNNIIGYINTVIEFNKKRKLMRFFIAPNLTQELYLGYDFWNKFGISPTINELNKEFDIHHPSNKHELDTIQSKMLNNVICLLPSSQLKGLGKTHLITHVINVNGADPVKQRLYPISPAVQADIYLELDRMLALNVIETSNSSWCSPVTMVKKSNGKTRICLDARRLNQVTVKDAYPMPLIESLLSRLTCTKFISSIDLKDAFWQIPLHDRSKELTASAVPGRPLYHFTVMPFGLCNAPQTMCRLMDKVIPYQYHDRVFVYLDDILVTSADFEEHLQTLTEVALRLTESGLTINIDKSNFCLKQIPYLGYIVGEGILRINPDKVIALTLYPPPKNVKGVRRFLGMTGWYRRFIQNFSTISAPLSELLKKGQKFKWSQETQIAFEKLKEAISTAPVLINPNFNNHFYVQCDASTTGIGSVLFQLGEDGSEHPIAFFSRKLNKTQKNYSVVELECLAAVESVCKFRGYIEGHPFTIITDHASLAWLTKK